jgi:hypothetical protein
MIKNLRREFHDVQINDVKQKGVLTCTDKIYAIVFTLKSSEI